MSEPAQGWYPDPSDTPPFTLVERQILGVVATRVMP